jgi:pimeloyl-ACP methyl ester carboxylesterase
VGYDAAARLAQLHVPTAVMHGRRDRLVPFALAEELRDGIHGAVLVPLDGGHLYTLTHSTALAKRIHAYLTAV